MNLIYSIPAATFSILSLLAATLSGGVALQTTPGVCAQGYAMTQGASPTDTLTVTLFTVAKSSTTGKRPQPAQCKHPDFKKAQSVIDAAVAAQGGTAK